MSPTPIFTILLLLILLTKCCRADAPISIDFPPNDYDYSYSDYDYYNYQQPVSKSKFYTARITLRNALQKQIMIMAKKKKSKKSKVAKAKTVKEPTKEKRIGERSTQTIAKPPKKVKGMRSEGKKKTQFTYPPTYVLPQIQSI